MAIKFDELLEALDPSLDKFEEDLNSMWIIIPTERRYDDLTASDYLKFARKYGTFNNQKDCFDKIEELAPDRWDAFIPMKLEGVNESLNNSDVNKGYTYKGYRIIYTDGVWHVFFEDKGTGRVDFSTDKEAEEYIDNLLGN